MQNDHYVDGRNIVKLAPLLKVKKFQGSSGVFKDSKLDELCIKIPN